MVFFRLNSLQFQITQLHISILLIYCLSILCYFKAIFLFGSYASVAMSTEANTEAVDGSLEEGLLCLLRPAVETINEKTEGVKQSQQQLGEQIEQLSLALDRLAHNQSLPVDIDHYTRNIANSKRRVLLLGSSVNSIQERLTRLQRQITLEIAKRRNILETTPTTTPVRTEAGGAESKPNDEPSSSDNPQVPKN